MLHGEPWTAEAHECYTIHELLVTAEHYDIKTEYGGPFPIKDATGLSEDMSFDGDVRITIILKRGQVERGEQ